MSTTKQPLTFELENAIKSLGYKHIAGTDEAGRGPLAGPVFAAAVILSDEFLIEGLNDSKKLTEKKREILFDLICQKALAWSIAFCTPQEIDEKNILGASQLAMNRAVENLAKYKTAENLTTCNTTEIPAINADFVLVDGNIARGFTLPCQCVIGGDAKSPSIAAASILAKVSRDRVMMEYDKIYPIYDFAKHKGYPTPAHMETVKKYGPCPIHRKSFLSFLNKYE